MSRVIFCGNLPVDVRTREIEDLFYKFGKIVEIDVKTPSRPPGFAFVEFASARDAEDACRGRDGYEFAGGRIRVELAKGGARRGGKGGGYGGGYGGGISRRSQFRVKVTGLPRTCSWQDLKDFMRKSGDVTFANVFKDGDGMVGIVDFALEDDLKYAIRKLDDTEFERGCYVRVKEDTEGSPGRSRSRSPKRRSRRRSPSRSRSRDRSASKSRSRSVSPAKRASRSKSRSPAASLSRSPSR